MLTPAERILEKALMPTHLSSEEIRTQIAADIRRRSFFSATVSEASYLKKLQEITARFATGEINGATAREEMTKWLASVGYDATGKPGITSLLSRRRQELIYKTNTDMGAGVAMAARETARTVAEYPAWRLERYGARMRPREDWPARWTLAGDSVGWEGAVEAYFVALKNSPIWQAIGDGAGGFRDALGNAFPPFAYSSGLAWTPVAREECVRLGLDVGAAAPSGESLSPGKAEIAAAMQRLGPGFARELQGELEEALI